MFPNIRAGLGWDSSCTKMIALRTQREKRQTLPTADLKSNSSEKLSHDFFGAYSDNNSIKKEGMGAWRFPMLAKIEYVSLESFCLPQTTLKTLNKIQKEAA